MKRRQIVCVVLLIALVIIAQAVLASPYWKNLSYSPAPYWLHPGVLGLASGLVGVLLQGIFAPRNRRLPLPWSIPLGIVSLLIVCVMYLWGVLPIPTRLANALLSADFVRIIAGVLLGALVANRIRRDDTATAVGQGAQTGVGVSHE